MTLGDPMMNVDDRMNYKEENKNSPGVGLWDEV